MFLAFLFLVIFIISYIFVSRKRSPVPYFPTNKKDIPLIIKTLNLKLNHTVVDLGAGDGVVVFKAANEAYARGFDTKFYAIEINPVLIIILYIKRLFHKNKKNIYILKDDFLTTNLKKFNNAMFYLYLSPKYINLVYKRIKKEVSNPKIITYYYKIQNIKTIKEVKKINKIFLYI